MFYYDCESLLFIIVVAIGFVIGPGLQLTSFWQPLQGVTADRLWNLFREYRQS